MRLPFERAMGRDENTVHLQEVVKRTTSLAPPPPLSTDDVCPNEGEPETLKCAGMPPVAELVSIPPARSAVACYTGTTLDGRYKIETILGEGGMGIVYLARHKVIDKRVAVKVLRADFAHQKEITDRFLQEAKAASSIGNPHIVDISDFGELPDGSTYFVMEWLDGVPLSKLTQDRRPVPMPRLLDIARQIADGLGAAHSAGIVHRDLKPDNVFLIRHGSAPDFVKILDFGIAKVMNDASKKVTRAGALFGTPHYMSPEQAAGTPVDARTDVYALGVMLYELASGKLPFDADNLMGILTQHMFKAAEPIRRFEATVPPGLEAIVMKALSKHPDQRYATMQALSQDLDKLARGENPDALAEMMVRAASQFPPALAERSMPEPIPASPRRTRTRWGVYAGVSAILVACCLVVGVFLQASSSTAQPSRPDAKTAPQAPATTAVESKSIDAPEAPTSVLFAAEPLDAHVFKGDVDLGTTPITLEVPAGGLRVDVRRPGYRPRTIVVDGSQKKVSIKLVPASDRPSFPKPAPRSKPRSKGWDRSGEIINPWPTK
jgi:serine/threonine-protein kinase